MSPSAPFFRFLPDEEATLQWGGSWAATLSAPLVVYLQGDLGAGKTTFTRGLLRGLGYGGAVKSPTYAIVESYPLPAFTLHHFDLYRFTAPEEWDDAGLDDLADGHSICLIEWPQLGEGFAPLPDIDIHLGHTETGRRATLNAHTETGQKSLEAWFKN